MQDLIWIIVAGLGAVLLFRGHRMIQLVGALIGAIAGFIASDFLLMAVPSLASSGFKIKIALAGLGAVLVYSMLIYAMRTVAGLGVYMAFSSLVLMLESSGYEISQNHTNFVGIGLAVGSFILTWNMRRAMPLLASLIVGATLLTSAYHLFNKVPLELIDPIRPDPMWLWIILLCIGFMIQSIDIKKRKHLKNVKEGVVFDPKLSTEKNFQPKKEKGLSKYMEKEPWH